MEIFDSHLHIIDKRYPLIENQGFMPNPFTSKDYLQIVKDINVRGGAVVSGSFQGFDQSYLIDTLKILGDQFVGVTQLPHNVPDEYIIELDKYGVKAIRFNVNRGGSEDISRLDYFARRVYELVNWHTELYINSNTLPEITTIIEKLPAVSIDHLGLSRHGLPNLLYLVDKGVMVKATGFGRVDFDVAKAIKKIHSINPDALMFGTDLPSTRAKRPFRFSDIKLIKDALDEEAAKKVFYKNALQWYLSK